LPIGGLKLQPWNLAAQDRELVPQHHELQLLGSITAREQHERLDQRQSVREASLDSTRDGLPTKAAGAPPYPAADANRQLTAHARLCAPFRVGRNTLETCRSAGQRPDLKGLAGPLPMPLA